MTASPATLERLARFGLRPYSQSRQEVVPRLRPRPPWLWGPAGRSAPPRH
jgi:hypothetical protein